MDTLAIPGLPFPSSRLALGTAEFGAGIDEATAFALLDDYAAAGGNHLDTAHIYAAWVPGCWGSSERVIGSWLRSRGMAGRMLVATKGGHMHFAGDHPPRVRPEVVHFELRESLERLGLERVELYYLHRDDPSVPVEPLLAALEAERAAGRIGAYGCSNWTVPRLREAAAIARARGWEGFRAHQVEWSLATVPAAGAWDLRAMDPELFAWHRASALPVTAFTPQASGFFARDWDSDAAPASHARFRVDPRNLRRWRRANARAAARGVPTTRLALAWLLAQPIQVIPVIGCKTRAQLADSLAALRIRLSPAEVSDLERGAA
ncbi:MAG: aldo/keto reductase [Planctomycetes bacterium]|nr:aldo/keto reductase [Planctomycetota bacterium]